MERKFPTINYALPGHSDTGIDILTKQVDNFIDLRWLPKTIAELPKNIFVENALPMPRLELRWDQITLSLMLLEYNLVLPIQSEDPRIEQCICDSKRKSVTYTLDEEEFENRMNTWKDEHFLIFKENNELEINVDKGMFSALQRDSFTLKLPAYVIYRNIAMFVEPDCEIKHPAPYPALGVSKKPPQNVVLDTSTDGPVLHFLEELSNAQMSREFVDAFIMQLVNACMDRNNGRANAELIVNKVDNTLCKVLNSRVVNDVCNDARNFVNCIFFKFDLLDIWLPPMNKAPYRFGGWIGNDIMLQYDDSVLKLEK